MAESIQVYRIDLGHQEHFDSVAQKAALTETCSSAGSPPSQPALLPTILLEAPYFLIKLEGFLLLPLPPPSCLTSMALP